MKRKVKKGFTLAELLIVIGILGVLVTMMTLSMGSVRGKAKATAIVSNIDVCKKAAVMFYLSHLDEADNLDASDFLKDDSEYVFGWSNFSSKGIKYNASKVKEFDYWSVTVDFREDGDKEGIIKALSNTEGYNAKDSNGDLIVSTGHFMVKLATGKIETPLDTGQHDGNEDDGNNGEPTINDDLGD